MNVDDRDVVRFLKYFTFLTQDQISELEQRFNDEPWKREAQRTLARELTTLVHGPEAMNSAEQISYALFYGKVAELDPDQLLQALGDVPTYDLNGVDSIGLVELLTEAQVVASKRRAREDIKNGAITVNDVRLKDVNKTLEPADRIAGNYIVIRRGKNKYFLVRWQS